MSKCIIVKSITYAQKAKKVLMDKGITAYISKQSYNKKYSCAWCVSVKEKDLKKSIDTMKLEGVKMSGDVYAA